MKDIPELDGPGLRRFALMTSAILVVLFGGLLPWVFEHGWPVWPWVVAGVLSLWGLAHPVSLKPVYTLWMKFGLVMGAISSRIILFVVFFLLFMPMGVVMRLLGKDPLHKELQPDTVSYRKIRHDYNPKHMERPF